MSDSVVIAGPGLLMTRSQSANCQGGTSASRATFRRMTVSLDQATVEAIAHEVADLLRRRDDSNEHAFLSAGQVAARFGVDRSWVYEHAHQLGVVRLGFGRRPRLRFDPAIVAQCLLAQPPQASSAKATYTPGGSAPLLPVRAPTARPRRNLRAQMPPSS